MSSCLFHGRSRFLSRPPFPGSSKRSSSRTTREKRANPCSRVFYACGIGARVFLPARARVDETDVPRMTTSLVSGVSLRPAAYMGPKNEEDSQGSLSIGFKFSDLQSSITRILISIIYRTLWYAQKCTMYATKNYRERNLEID